MQVLQSPPKITLTFGHALCESVVKELSLLSERIKQVAGVRSVMTRLDLHGNQQVIIDTQAGVEHANLLRRMASALRAPVPATPSHSVSTVSCHARVGVAEPIASVSRGRQVVIETDPGPEVLETEVRSGMMQRVRQRTYGVLAVGSVGMAWIGLLVPGIPTVPFVILAAVLASKSSPAFHNRLRKTRVFGPMIRDWEEHRAVRPRVKMQAVIVTVAIVGFTVVFAPPSPTLYTLIGTMSVFSLAVISQIPVIPTNSSEIETSHQPAGPKLFSTVA